MSFKATSEVSTLLIMDFQQAISEFISLAGKIDSKDNRRKFFQWINENINDLKEDEDEARWGTANIEEELKCIAAELRKYLPSDATLSSETIIPPSIGPNSDCNATNTVHVDAFLYDEDLLDSLVEDGKLSRSYCKDCGSKNTSPVNIISHSSSIPRLRAIFQEILPDLTGKVVLDIGSRLGPVLYGAYYYSNAAKIIGIEINQEFVQLQNQVVQSKGFMDRIEVIHGNICQRVDILKTADVIVLNNVFEFFVSPENHVEIWQFLRREINPGTLLVTIPSLEEQFAALHTGIVLASWVKPLPPCNPAIVDDYEELELSEVKLYQVL